MRLPGRVVVPLKSMCSRTWDKARAEPFAFHDAAGIAPGLGRDDRRAVVFPNDDHQPVFQSHQPHVRRNTRNLPFPAPGTMVTAFCRFGAGAAARFRDGAVRAIFCFAPIIEFPEESPFADHFRL